MLEASGLILCPLGNATQLGFRLSAPDIGEKSLTSEQSIESSLRCWQGQFVKKEVAKVAFNHLQGGGGFVVGAVQRSFALGMEGEAELHRLVPQLRAGQELRRASPQQITWRCTEENGRKGL